MFEGERERERNEREMENANLSGYSVNNFLSKVDLPVPEGPER